ncbi:MAG: ABC transporter substrate-binding protein [Eubacteriales bacterium]
MKKSKKLISLLIAVLLVAAALAACAQTPATTSAAASASASVSAAAPSVSASVAAASGSTKKLLDRPINIGYYQGNCEAHFYAAEKLGLFEKYGLDIDYTIVDDSNAATSLAAGKIDVTDGILQGWIKPIEQGLDVRFTLGMQQGCMGTVALASSSYKTLADLKGKTIGVLGVIGGGPYNYLIRTILHETTLDPNKDFEYIAYGDPAALNNALESGKVDAVVSADPLNYAGVSAGKYRQITLMATDDYLKDETCCLLAFNPKFISEHKEAATAFTKAIYEGAQYVENNKEEIIKYAFDKKYIVNGTLEDNVAITKPYEFKPSYDIAVKSFSNSFADYQKAGLIDKTVDLQKVLDRAFVNLNVG